MGAGTQTPARAKRLPSLGLLHGMKARRSRVTLSIVVTGDEPPSEFRIFTAGKVETTKGEFLFDDKAAASVMAEYEKHGIDVMVDYDHASLAGLSLDPAQSGKAAGWFNLEVRNGELWAVNVRWTPPALEALKRKEWRFMSPAFQTDEEGRITSLLNVAITNLPATRQLEPLMAANAITQLGENGMSVEEFLKVCKALGIDMSSSLEDAMAKIKGDEKKPAEEKPKEEPPPAAMNEGEAPPEEKKEEIAASITKLARLTGKTSFVDMLAEVETWRESHLTLEKKTQELAKEREVFEAASRRKGCADLVTLAGRKPAEVWADDKATAPKKYLASMSLSDFNEYVADAIKAAGGKRPPAFTPPARSDALEGGREFETTNGKITLSASELKACADKKVDPAKYAETRAAIKARSSRGTGAEV